MLTASQQPAGGLARGAANGGVRPAAAGGRAADTRAADTRAGGALPNLAEAALTILVALALARLVWAAVTPAGPMGDWRGRLAAPTSAPTTGITPTAAPAGFDPFFGAGPIDGRRVSDLALVLVGTRVDTVSGRGAAIIATPDGAQQSYLVGETIVPGVVLTGVAFDSATLKRGGAPGTARAGNREQLFLDQSAPAQPQTAAPAASGAAAGAGPGR